MMDVDKLILAEIEAVTVVSFGAMMDVDKLIRLAKILEPTRVLGL